VSNTGKYNFADLVELHTQLNKEFGPIVKFSGLAPKNDFVFIYDPKDVETVFRNDGLWPIRPPIKSLEYYRKHTRKDFFKGVGGLILE
jgi:cytochrome P450 family 12